MGTTELSVTIAGDMARAGEVVRAALSEEGFGVLTEIDVEATLRAKLGDAQADEVGPTRIVGACNPGLAHRAIMTERDVTHLLPCNIVLRSVSDGVEVSVADPAAMVDFAGEGLTAVATEARAKLERVISALRT